MGNLHFSSNLGWCLQFWLRFYFYLTYSGCLVIKALAYVIFLQLAEGVKVKEQIS